MYSRVRNYITLKAYNVKYAAYPGISGTLVIKGNGSISMGKRVILNSSAESNPVGLANQTIFQAFENCKIQLGNNVGISNSLLSSMASITIEEDVRIGGGSQLLDNDFHSIYYAERIANPDPGIKSAPILIKKGAFIGCNSLILKGVTVGAFSIVSAGSVLVKSIPDNEIWGGNPAKFIKKIEQ